jgi:hypothetical protein
MRVKGVSKNKKENSNAIYPYRQKNSQRAFKRVDVRVYFRLLVRRSAFHYVEKGRGRSFSHFWVRATLRSLLLYGKECAYRRERL